MINLDKYFEKSESIFYFQFQKFLVVQSKAMVKLFSIYFLLALSFSAIAKYQNQNQSSSVLSIAISEIIRNQFVKNSIRFDLIIYGQQTTKLTKLADEILRNSRELFAGRILVYDGSPTWDHKVSRSAILLFDSNLLLYQFNSKVILTNDYPTKMNFYAFCLENLRGASYESSIITHLLNFIIRRVDGSIKLFAATHFSKGKCHRIDYVAINEFSLKALRWRKKKFEYKVRDFFGCEVTLIVKNWPKNITNSTDNAERDFLSNVVKNLARSLNFRFSLNTYKRETEFHNSEYLKLTFRAMNNMDKDGGFISFTHTAQFNFLIPFTELYSPLEKLLLPFDDQVWYWFLSFMAVGLVVIFVVNRLSMKVQAFVFGDGVTTPTLNVFRAFFGVGQMILPRLNFARYILMMFIMYCLVIRTAYQGMMFEFLQKEMRKPEHPTVENLIEKNFTFNIDERVHFILSRFECLKG